MRWNWKATVRVLLCGAIATLALAQEHITLGAFYTKPGRLIQLLPQLMPGSATNLAAQDVYVTEMTFSNVTGSSVTVTVQDRQATPVIIFQAAIAANTNYVVRMDSRWSPNGITWSASTGAAVVGYITGSY